MSNPSSTQTNSRLMPPERAVDTMLEAISTQLASPVGGQLLPELATMYQSQGREGFESHFRGLPPKEALTQLVQATGDSCGVDCNASPLVGEGAGQDKPLGDWQNVTLISEARGEALMLFADAGEWWRMTPKDADDLAWAVTLANGSARRHKITTEPAFEQLTARLASRPDDSGSYARRLSDGVVTSQFKVEPEKLAAFNEAMGNDWHKVAASSDGQDAIYVQRNPDARFEDALTARYVSNPGAVLAGMTMINDMGRAERISMATLSEHGIMPTMLDVSAPVSGNGAAFSETFAGIIKGLDLDIEDGAALPDPVKNALRIAQPESSSAPALTTKHTSPGM
ncbi:hypothetical protein VRRI112168_14860 [Vreelandella rituensis]|uniref:Uncharacterized protein n=1 Tax=Vreelandella rituensis TaxID=2282306 RepID=A0A368UB48_9GAMM|nr:hypothetical protein [Halomonas rituensis]RCV93797.1 hypothetical protein DU506_01170 [Halomonas rituensis]